MAGADLHPVLSLAVRHVTRVTCDCGVSSLAEVVAVIDVAQEAGLAADALTDDLNKIECSACQAPLRADRPVVLFDSEAQAVFLLLGRGQRHDGLRAMSAYLSRLADAASGEPLPGFAAQPRLAFGGEGLARARESVERLRGAVSAEASAEVQSALDTLDQDRRELEIRGTEVDQRATELDDRVTGLDERQTSLDEREELVAKREVEAEGRFTALGARTDELKAVESEIEAKGEQVLEAEREVEAKGRAVEEVRRSLEKGAMGAAFAESVSASDPAESSSDQDAASEEDSKAKDSEDESSDSGTEDGSEAASDEAATATAEAEGPDDADEAPAEGGDDKSNDADPPRSESWDQNLDSEWVLDGEEKAADTVAPPAVQIEDGPEEVPQGDRDPTVRVQIGDLARRADSKEVEVLAPRPAAGPIPEFDGDRAGGDDRYWVMDEGELFLCLKRGEEELAQLLAVRLDLRFQVHRPPQGALAALTLVSLTQDGERVEACWFFNPAEDDDRKALNALAAEFRPQLVLFDDDGDPQRLLPFEQPLADNVVVGLDRASSWVDGEDRAGFKAAVEVVGAKGYDLLGEKSHPFHSEAFGHIADAARTRFVVNVVEYWNSADNRDYLLLIKSFPAVEMGNLIQRTVNAAVQFGIALGDSLTERALALGAAKSRRELVQSQLASFTEVALRLKHSGLDEVAEWENWESLLAQAEECGVSVDSSILGIAEGAMGRVKLMMEGGDRPTPAASTGENRVATPPPPPPPSAHDPGLPPGMQRSDVTQEIDPDVDSDLFLDIDGDDSELADLSAKELVAQLDEEGKTAEASMVVVARGDREVADALVKRVRGKQGPGRTAALECLASLGEVAVAAVTEGVKSKKRGDETLDDAVAILVRAVGKARVERLRRDRSRKVRDAARRALKRLSDGETDPGTREEEAIANALLGGGGGNGGGSDSAADGSDQPEDASL